MSLLIGYIILSFATVAAAFVTTRKVGRVEKQLKPNGGDSPRDVMDRTEAKLDELMDRVDTVASVLRSHLMWSGDTTSQVPHRSRHTNGH